MHSTVYSLQSAGKRVALVHDYLKEFGGAERVLKVIAEMYPEAPIYTAFSVKNSVAQKEFVDTKIHESWLSPLLKVGKLYSPLRFLTPLIWSSFSAKGGSAYGRDLSGYDLVITSCSWYITRGFKVGPKTKVVAYCHTPPRWLYGYETSVGFTKYWPVKVYAAIVGHFMRLYDWKTSQTINHWIANSEEVKSRIKKFYRKDSVVIYPPIDTKRISVVSVQHSVDSKKTSQQSTVYGLQPYFLIVSRLVGAKGVEEAISAFSKQDKYVLKIVGEAHGFSNLQSTLSSLQSTNIELLGRVDDDELYKLYAGAKGFIALAKQEDFGMTVVEAMAAGCPVIAYNGGGFKETVVDGITGILINGTDKKTIEVAIKKFENINWNRKEIQKHAEKFSKERFVREFKKFIAEVL